MLPCCAAHNIKEVVDICRHLQFNCMFAIYLSFSSGVKTITIGRGTHGKLLYVGTSYVAVSVSSQS